MAFFFFVDDGADINFQILVAGIFSEQSAQIVVFLAEKASTQFSVGGQTNSRTVSAKGLRHWSDQANFAGRAVRETVFSGGLAGFVGNLRQRPDRKSTRLNSSHSSISYAVFCLK